MINRQPQMRAANKTILKLTEEVGEAAEALIGVRGLFSELP